MANVYSSERGYPSVPQCGRSKLALLFGNGSLHLLGGTKSYAYPAKSGKPGVYAPIVKGRYWIQPDEMWRCDTLRQVVFWAEGTTCDDSGWGMYRITIHPYPTTAIGHGGYFIHGGSHEGSAGCINLGPGISNFIRDLKSELGGTAACFIPLTVR